MTPRQEGVFAGFDLDSIDSINLLKLTIQMCKGTEQGGNFDDQNPLLVNSLGDATQVRTVINILESMKKNTFLRQLVEDFGRIGRYEMVAAAQRMEPLFEIAAGGPKAPGYHQAMKDYKKGSSSIVNSEMQEAAETLVQMAGGSMEQRHRRSERLAGSDRSSKGEKEIEKENAGLDSPKNKDNVSGEVDGNERNSISSASEITPEQQSQPHHSQTPINTSNLASQTSSTMEKMNSNQIGRAAAKHAAKIIKQRKNYFEHQKQDDTNASEENNTEHTVNGHTNAGDNSSSADRVTSNPATFNDTAAHDASSRVLPSTTLAKSQKMSSSAENNQTSSNIPGIEVPKLPIHRKTFRRKEVAAQGLNNEYANRNASGPSPGPDPLTSQGLQSQYDVDRELAISGPVNYIRSRPVDVSSGMGSMSGMSSMSGMGALSKPDWSVARASSELALDAAPQLPSHKATNDGEDTKAPEVAKRAKGKKATKVPLVEEEEINLEDYPEVHLEPFPKDYEDGYETPDQPEDDPPVGIKSQAPKSEPHADPIGYYDRRPARVGHRDVFKLEVSFPMMKKSEINPGKLVKARYYRNKYFRQVDWNSEKDIKQLNSWRAQQFVRHFGSENEARPGWLESEKQDVLRRLEDNLYDRSHPDWKSILRDYNSNNVGVFQQKGPFVAQGVGKPIFSKNRVAPVRSYGGLTSQANSWPETKSMIDAAAQYDGLKNKPGYIRPQDRVAPAFSAPAGHSSSGPNFSPATPSGSMLPAPSSESYSPETISPAPVSPSHRLPSGELTFIHYKPEVQKTKTSLGSTIKSQKSDNLKKRRRDQDDEGENDRAGFGFPKSI